MDNRVTVMWCNFHSNDFLTIAGVPVGLIRNRGMTACTWLHAIQAEKVRVKFLVKKSLRKKLNHVSVSTFRKHRDQLPRMCFLSSVAVS